MIYKKQTYPMLQQYDKTHAMILYINYMMILNLFNLFSFHLKPSLFSFICFLQAKPTFFSLSTFADNGVDQFIPPLTFNFNLFSLFDILSLIFISLFSSLEP